MTDSISPPIDRLRVAAALIAIKHKPPSQSLPSYVLDLQAAFNDRRPAADASLGSQSHGVEEDPQLPPRSPSGNGYHDRSTWRAHAMHLESEAVWLKAQLDAERVKNATLTAAAIKAGLSLSLPNGSDGGASAAAILNPLDPQPQPSSSSVGTGKDSGNVNAGGEDGGGGKKRVRKNTKQQQPQRVNQCSHQTQTQSTLGLSNTVPLNPSQLLACIKLLSMDDCVSTPRSGSASISPLAAVDQLFRLAEWIASSNTPDEMSAQTGDREEEGLNLDLLAASVGVSVDAISLELGSVMRSSSTGNLTAESLKAFDVYAAVLQSIAASVLALFDDTPPRQPPTAKLKSSRDACSMKLSPSRYSEQLDRCLNALSQRVVLPCIRSFLPLSIQHLQFIREGSAKDPRPHVLSLIRKLLSTLFSARSPLQEYQIVNLALVDAFRMSLILDILAELNRTLFRGDAVRTNLNANSGTVDPLTAIWNSSGLLNCAQPTSSPPGTFEKTTPRDLAASPPPNPGKGAPPTAQADQTLKDHDMYLAEKDCAWFLCAVLHLLSARSELPSGASSPSLPSRPSKYSYSLSSSSSLATSWSVPASSDPKSIPTRTAVRSPASLDETREHMREAVVDGVLGLLSRCGKACGGCTRNGNLNRRQGRNSSPSIADRIPEPEPEPGRTRGKVAGASSIASDANTGRAPAQKASPTVQAHEAKSMESVRRESGRSGCGDEVVYAMVLGAAERVLIVYA